MKILKLVGLLIIVSIIILAGILNFTKTELTVENAEFNANYENIYPSSCFIKFENRKFLVQEIYKYKHKILNEYWFVASEGFAIQKFEFPFEMNYNNEQKKYRILKYTENEKLIYSSLIAIGHNNNKLTQKQIKILEILYHLLFCHFALINHLLLLALSVHLCQNIFQKALL